MTIYTTFASPLGELLLAGRPDGDVPGGVALTSLAMPGQRGAAGIQPDWTREDAAFAHVTAQLDAYFAGYLTEFDLAYTPSGTPFQRQVWQAVDAIPFGRTTTYGQIAAAIGVPREDAVKVGAAVGANPLLLVRPCHRVIGADGSLKGYSAGIERKQLLLEHEGVLTAPLV